HRGTYRPHGAVARREPGLVAAWRIGEAQARRARPLQDRPCQRFQGRRRSRDESGRHLTAATRLLETQWLMRRLSARMRERWREFKKSLRSIRVAIIIGPRARPLPTETLSGNWDSPVRPRNQRQIEEFSQRRKVLQGSSHS